LGLLRPCRRNGSSSVARLGRRCRAGEPDIVEKCKKGHKAGDKTFKVHIDGYNLLDFLTKEGVRSPREGFFYFDDDGQLVALRYDNWKVVFEEQRRRGTLEVWLEPFTQLRAPKLFNLRTVSYERADVTSNTYWESVDKLTLCPKDSASG
jgi:arylsulfatase